MIRYSEESHEIFSCSLYSARSCESIINHIRKSKSWSAAKVRKHQANGKSRSVQLTSVRQALILDPSRASDIYDDFDRRMERKVKPLIRHHSGHLGGIEQTESQSVASDWPTKDV